MARDWNRHYSDPLYLDQGPDALLAGIVDAVPPGRALDLACGAGRHAIYLTRLGWQVVAVDAARAAIDRVRRAEPRVDARVADLEQGEFVIEPLSFDLICDFHYLQRDLFPAIRDGVRPGGMFVGAIHLPPRSFSMESGELREEFAGWKILYYSEMGGSARIVARRA